MNECLPTAIMTDSDRRSQGKGYHRKNLIAWALFPKVSVVTQTGGYQLACMMDDSLLLDHYLSWVELQSCPGLPANPSPNKGLTMW